MVVRHAGDPQGVDGSRIRLRIITGVRDAFAGEDSCAHEQGLHAQLRRHAARFADLEAIPAIPFNVAQDWDERRKLKPGTQVHSPFIRHHADWRLG
jgi:hypothetical protein